MRKKKYRNSIFKRGTGIFLAIMMALGLSAGVTMADESETSPETNNQEIQTSDEENTNEQLQIENKDNEQEALQEELLSELIDSAETRSGAGSIPTGLVAGMGSVGTATVLGLYINFPDVEFDKGDTKEAFQNRITGAADPESEDYPYESLNAYYSRASYGRLSITGDVYAYTAQHNREWYIDNGGVAVLAEEAIKALDETIDYTKYDTNGNTDGTPDGVVDAVYLHYAGGASEGWGTTYWSHLLNLTSIEKLDGKSFGAGAGLHNASNSDSGATTILHETGHILGMPDLYYYGTTPEWRTGTLTWDMMEKGIGDIDAYFKWLLGWIDYSDITRIVANDNGIKVYKGDKLEKTVSLSEASYVDVLQEAFDSADTTKTGGFITVSNTDAQTEKEAMFSDFFLVTYEQNAANQSVVYSPAAFEKAKVPSGFRIYKIQGKTKNGMFVHNNTACSQHNLLIENLDYDYADSHSTAGTGDVPSSGKETYNCYLPVGKTFDYQTSPSTNFQENRAFGYTGISFTVNSADESNGSIRIGYSSEGKVNPKDLTISYSGKSGVIAHKYLKFTASQDVKKGKITTAYLYVNGEKKTLNLNISGSEITAVMDYYTPDYIQADTTLKVVFPAKTFILSYDTNGNPVYNEKITVKLSTGPAAQIISKTKIKSDNIEYEWAQSNVLAAGDTVYRAYYEVNNGEGIHQMRLAYFDRLNPKSEKTVEIKNFDITSYKELSKTSVLAANDEVVVMAAVDISNVYHLYWINPKTGKIIAKKVMKTFNPNMFVGAYAVTDSGRFYFMQTQSSKESAIPLYHIYCLYLESGTLKEIDVTLKDSRNNLAQFYASEDYSEGKEKMLLSFYGGSAEETGMIYNTISCDESKLFDLLKSNDGKELDQSELSNLSDKAYAATLSTNEECVGMYLGKDQSLIQLVKVSTLVGDQYVSSYQLTVQDKAGKEKAKIALDSATEYTGMEFTKIIQGEDGMIAVVGALAENHLTSVNSDHQEIILLNEDELEGNTSTLTCGKYICVNYLQGYFKDSGCFVGLYNGGMDQARTAYTVAVGKSIKLSKDYFTVDQTDKTYKGEAVQPAVKSALKEGTDYKVYYLQNISAGIGRTVIKGIGNYTGRIEFTYKINLAKPEITKTTAGKNKLTVTWKNSNAKKYIIRYRVKGTSKWTTKTVTQTSAVLKSLKTGKKYQIKIIAKFGKQKAVSSAVTTAKIK